MEEKCISVIIPAHNEELIIKDTLKSIIYQTYKPNNIIVACDNCTDNTILIIDNSFYFSNIHV